jgi:hypothetical protein
MKQRSASRIRDLGNVTFEFLETFDFHQLHIVVTTMPQFWHRDETVLASRSYRVSAAEEE